MRARSLHSRHAVASNFGVLVRLEQRPPNLAPAAAANGCGVRHIHGASVRPRRLGKQGRAAAQQREQQYRADYYARTTREQEERENREARERFIASQHKNST